MSSVLDIKDVQTELDKLQKKGIAILSAASSGNMSSDTVYNAIKAANDILADNDIDEIAKAFEEDGQNS